MREESLQKPLPKPLQEPLQKPLSEPLNRTQMVLIALIQGLLLFWLKEALIEQTWPHDVRVAEVLLWSVFISVPILMLLSINRDNQKRVLQGTLGFAVVVALISAYMGWQLEPDDKIRAEALLWIYALTLAVLGFKVVMYLQIWANKEAFTYSRLFVYSWRNSILVVLCLLFVLIFGGILFLWAALFSVVGIDFFSDIFKESWFLFPALALANGLAFTIFRQLVGIVDTMSRVLRALCQFLLPVLAFISILFLVCLPFVGFSALWDTGRGTALVLWLQALTLFFFNATFQGEEDSSPYWQHVQKLVYAGILVLPIYSVIATYGLWLRIDQYGLTVARLWAVVVVGLLALFAFSYTANLAINRTNAASKFGWINVRVGLVLLALMILVNSPILDFRKMTVNSQLVRLNSDQIKPKDFDAYYFARELGRPGHLALEELKTDANDQLLGRIRRAQRGYDLQYEPIPEPEIKERISLYPEDLEVPKKLMDRILEQESYRRDLSDLHIINRDLNLDGEGEWIVLRQASYGYINAELWRLKATGWYQRDMRINKNQIEDLGQLLSENQIRVEVPTWKIIRVGDLIIHYSEWR